MCDQDQEFPWQSYFSTEMTDGLTELVTKDKASHKTEESKHNNDLEHLNTSISTSCTAQRLQYSNSPHKQRSSGHKRSEAGKAQTPQKNGPRRETPHHQDGAQRHHDSPMKSNGRKQNGSQRKQHETDNDHGKIYTLHDHLTAKAQNKKQVGCFGCCVSHSEDSYHKMSPEGVTAGEKTTARDLPLSPRSTSARSPRLQRHAVSPPLRDREPHSRSRSKSPEIHVPASIQKITHKPQLPNMRSPADVQPYIAPDVALKIYEHPLKYSMGQRALPSPGYPPYSPRLQPVHPYSGYHYQRQQYPQYQTDWSKNQQYAKSSSAESSLSSSDSCCTLERKTSAKKKRSKDNHHKRKFHRGLKISSSESLAKKHISPSDESGKGPSDISNEERSPVREIKTDIGRSGIIQSPESADSGMCSENKMPLDKTALEKLETLHQQESDNNSKMSPKSTNQEFCDAAITPTASNRSQKANHYQYLNESLRMPTLMENDIDNSNQTTPNTSRKSTRTSKSLESIPSVLSSEFGVLTESDFYITGQESDATFGTLSSYGKQKHNLQKSADDIMEDIAKLDRTVRENTYNVGDLEDIGIDLANLSPGESESESEHKDTVINAYTLSKDLIEGVKNDDDGKNFKNSQESLVTEENYNQTKEYFHDTYQPVQHNGYGSPPPDLTSIDELERIMDGKKHEKLYYSSGDNSSNNSDCNSDGPQTVVCALIHNADIQESEAYFQQNRQGAKKDTIESPERKNTEGERKSSSQSHEDKQKSDNIVRTRSTRNEKSSSSSSKTGIWDFDEKVTPYKLPSQRKTDKYYRDTRNYQSPIHMKSPTVKRKERKHREGKHGSPVKENDCNENEPFEREKENFAKVQRSNSKHTHMHEMQAYQEYHTKRLQSLHKEDYQSQDLILELPSPYHNQRMPYGESESTPDTWSGGYTSYTSSSSAMPPPQHYTSLPPPTNIGRCVLKIGAKCPPHVQQPGKFSHPKAVDVFSNKDMMILDSENCTLQIFNEKGECKKVYHFKSAIVDAMIWDSRTVALLRVGEIAMFSIPRYEVDTLPLAAVTTPVALRRLLVPTTGGTTTAVFVIALTTHVVVYSQSGQFLHTIPRGMDRMHPGDRGYTGYGNLFLQRVGRIAVNSKLSDVIVLDSHLKTIYIFNWEGRHKFTIDTKFFPIGPVANPQGMCLDKVGNIVVADTFNHRVIQIFQGGVRILLQYHPQFFPAAVTVTRDQRLIVAIDSEGRSFAGVRVYNYRHAIR